MIHSYGLIIGVAIVVSWQVAEMSLRAIGKRGEMIGESLWWMVIPTVVLSRAYHVVDNWGYYQNNLGQIGAIWEGGLGIFGAIVGAILGLLVYAWYVWHKSQVAFEETFFLLGDVYGLVVPLSQSIGRFGNFVNDELWGKTTTWEWVLMINPNGEMRHPLFLYESVLNLLLFVILMVVYHRKELRGSTLGGYLIGYGVIRLMLEPLREVSWEVNQIAVASVMSVVSVGVGIMILSRRKRFVVLG